MAEDSTYDEIRVEDGVEESTVARDEEAKVDSEQDEERRENCVVASEETPERAGAHVHGSEQPRMAAKLVVESVDQHSKNPSRGSYYGEIWPF